MISRHVMNDDDRDFSVSDSLSMTESFSEMTASFTIFLGAIAGVSLVVGSVGIGIAMFIRLISGLIPAYNASKMKPVDALGVRMN